MYNLDDLNNYGIIEDKAINKEDARIVEEESNIGIN
jgi:hypothetical protein